MPSILLNCSTKTFQISEYYSFIKFLFISCDEAIDLLWLTDYQIIRISVTDKFYEMTTSYINNINSRRYIEIKNLTINKIVKDLLFNRHENTSFEVKRVS